LNLSTSKFQTYTPARPCANIGNHLDPQSLKGHILLSILSSFTAPEGLEIHRASINLVCLNCVIVG